MYTIDRCVQLKYVGKKSMMESRIMVQQKRNKTKIIRAFVRKADFNAFKENNFGQKSIYRNKRLSI